MNGAIGFLFGGAIATISFLILGQHRHKRQQKRLLALTVYLEAASCGRETSLSRTEDEFSLLEDEIYKTVSELRIAREQAQQARSQQADNLSDIAHQLKTPLTAMSLMTQLLATDALPEQEEYIGRIDSQLSRLNWLTGSLLTMSRLDAKAVEFFPISLRFEELVAQSLEPIEQLLEKRRQILQVHGKELTLFCDAHWMMEALVNLIKNCSEHTPIDGQITLAAVSTPLYLQITIEDNGPGFDPAELSQIFRRFFQGKNSSKESIGIGLALSRGIIEGQNGMIRAENRLEGGARFIIRFYP